MNPTHPNPWTAQVHAHLLLTGVDATTREIEDLFGRPPVSYLGTTAFLANAARYGWFERVTKAGEVPIVWRALRKHPRYPMKEKDGVERVPVTEPFASVGRGALPWPSVWAYAGVQP